MPVNNDEIKKALDSFENDDFIAAKDILKKEIHASVNDYFKEKLNLQKDLDSPPASKPASAGEGDAGKE